MDRDRELACSIEDIVPGGLRPCREILRYLGHSGR